ncbi:MAG: MGMT family protein [Candidatus Sabulitectum sp.]|nr:MGMT family protein [Candidatus Sabulitectum sp.]
MNRIYLPSSDISPEEKIRQDHEHAVRKNSVFSEEISVKLTSLANGIQKNISLRDLEFSKISLFKKAVLNSLMEIPCGQTVSYGELAEKAGFTGAARAVGNALSSNPFPLAIPCHRVVRADGAAGFYQGGMVMKKHLLEAESGR